MDRNRDNVAVSALYTAATWQWAGLECADFVTPAQSRRLFRQVNAFLRLYRWINPSSYSLPHQLLYRHAAIDHLVQQAGHARVLELAAGFSARGSRFSRDPALRYIELDLPDMVHSKRRQLLASAAGRAVLARQNFELRAADALHVDLAAEFSGTPVSVISEGLMMYFTRAQQMQVWQGIVRLLQASGGVYLFDYIPLPDAPQRSLPGRLLHFLRLHVLRLRGDFTYDERDRYGVRADLLRAGFTQVEIIDTGAVASAWRLPQAAVPTRTLIYVCQVRRPQ